METPEKAFEKGEVNIEDIRGSFKRLGQEVFEAQKRLAEKEVGFYSLFKKHEGLILERLRKIVSPDLTEEDLQFDPKKLSVEIVSIGGNAPDEGMLSENVIMPEDMKKTIGDIAKSLTDLGLTAEFSSNFYGK